MSTNLDINRAQSEGGSLAALGCALEAAILAHAHLEHERPGDPGAFLRLTGASTDALRLCERLQVEAVQQARRANSSWSELGAVLGMTRQAAQQRFGPEVVPQDGPNGIKRISWATAFDEMRILKLIGAAGYHLVRVGGMSLEFESSPMAWEHLRAESMAPERLAALTEQGWVFVGRWFPFSYLKRQLDHAPLPAGAGAPGYELFPKEWTAFYEGYEIRVRNSWNKGLKLYVDGALLVEHDDMLALDRHTPIISLTLESEQGKSCRIDIFALAVLTVKIKIVINGKQIAGDAF